MDVILNCMWSVKSSVCVCVPRGSREVWLTCFSQMMLSAALIYSSLSYM